MKREAPATQRNREPILAVLQDILPETGLVLEIAAGTGEHAAYFAPRFPGLSWQPTDGDAEHLASIDAWGAEADAPGLLPAKRLDVTQTPWPVDGADAVLCINMVHISPWACTEALMAGAGSVLAPGGVLYLYGPYRVGGAHTSESNHQFEMWLKGQNPDWGVRHLEDVIAEAEKNGLVHETTLPMPANNFSVVFRKK